MSDSHPRQVALRKKYGLSTDAEVSEFFSNLQRRRWERVRREKADAAAREAVLLRMVEDVGEATP